MRLTELVVDGLAVWRLSSMLVNEAGPGEVFLRARETTGVLHDDAGNVSLVRNDWTPLGCLLCTSVWVGLVVASGIVPVWVRRALAISALAVLLSKEYGN